MIHFLVGEPPGLDRPIAWNVPAASPARLQ